MPGRRPLLRGSGGLSPRRPTLSPPEPDSEAQAPSRTQLEGRSGYNLQFKLLESLLRLRVRVLLPGHKKLTSCEAT